jgi:hypothetical protein
MDLFLKFSLLWISASETACLTCLIFEKGFKGLFYWKPVKTIGNSY